MKEFDIYKSKILKELALNQADLSPKGNVDEPIWPLIGLINSLDHYVTTSSCSGRVSVFLEGQKTGTGLGAKGRGGKWLFVSHLPQLKVWESVMEYSHDEDGPDGDQGQFDRYVLFKFEPMILHVKCRDWDSACKLFSTAMGCGFRESGIGPNYIVAIRVSLRLDAPLAVLREGKLDPLVTQDYVKHLERLSLELFDKNFAKMAQLKDAIETMTQSKPEKKETKEERRQRKMKEGLERQRQLQQAQAEKAAEQPSDTEPIEQSNKTME
uniref:tRNA wybutosine-synthesizing protein 3 n=1 Tax=Blastobotrys adeninivorans TaxID=409370 RepID=A0A060TBG7_BLAAD